SHCYPLSLHDALPILRKLGMGGAVLIHVAALDHGIPRNGGESPRVFHVLGDGGHAHTSLPGSADGASVRVRRRTIGHHGDLTLRSEEHTSELQSQSNL